MQLLDTKKHVVRVPYSLKYSGQLKDIAERVVHCATTCLASGEAKVSFFDYDKTYSKIVDFAKAHPTSPGLIVQAVADRAYGVYSSCEFDGTVWETPRNETELHHDEFRVGKRQKEHANDAWVVSNTDADDDQMARGNSGGLLVGA